MTRKAIKAANAALAATMVMGEEATNERLRILARALAHRLPYLHITDVLELGGTKEEFGKLLLHRAALRGLRPPEEIII